MSDEIMLDNKDELAKLREELRKVKRELRHEKKNNEMLRIANKQAAHNQEYIQHDNTRQMFLSTQLLKTSPNAMILTNERFQIVMASDQFYNYLGRNSKDRNKGEHLSDAFSGWLDEKQLSDVLEDCEDAMLGTIIEPYVIKVECNGKAIDLRITIRPMRTDEGDIVGLDIVFVDITEMINAREKADQANEAKSSFLANMSHEIRTPINAILGMDEMILRETEESATHEYAEDIKSAGKTLLAIINEILDFSKVEEGKMEIIPTRYELAPLIADIVNMVKDKADDKGLELFIDIDEETPHELYGDEIRIRQIILNLLNNAVKYTKEGSVRLGIGYSDLTASSLRLEVHVSDTGIGMKQEDMERLFSPFTRIEEKRNRKIEGTGLGMSITKKLLQLMGTTLSVDSVYGKGTTFSFSVKQGVVNGEPIGRFAEYFDKEHFVNDDGEYKASFYAPLAHILVVDDTQANLTVIRGLLKATGIQIDTVESGMDAVKLTAERDYDVLLIDHMMPEMDGIETLHAIKERDGQTTTVFIALTANAISGAREMYLEHGFDDYLSKPVEAKVLEALLEKYVPMSKQVNATPGLVISKSNFEDELEASSEAEVPEWLYEVPGLDVHSGIEDCGGEDSFISVVKTFHDTASQKYREIAEYYASEDWENYTIRVHGLKSSARIIGAAVLSKMAEELERAGNENDIEYIKAHNDACLGMYEMIDSHLMRFDEISEDLPEIEDKELSQAFEAIAEFAANMDFGSVEGVLNSLKEYKLKPEYDAFVKEINDYLMRLDFEAIEELMKEAR